MQSEDSVASFLNQVDAQEKKERDEKEKQEREDDLRQRQFEKQVMYGDTYNNYPQQSSQQDYDSSSNSLEGNSSPSEEGSGEAQEGSTPKPKKAPVVDENEMPEDNPIAALMAMKHPETVKAVEDASINEMAQGFHSAANRFVGVE